MSASMLATTRATPAACCGRDTIVACSPSSSGRRSSSIPRESSASLAPWNYPLTLAVQRTRSQRCMAGNAAVVKPDVADLAHRRCG